MKNEALYRRTVDILVAAYFNDTLVHLDCTACAVGNIVAANKGLVLERLENGMVKLKNAVYEENTKWFTAIFNGEFYQDCTEDVMEQIRITGYNGFELASIEYAFEHASSGGSNDVWMFNGLMAVIDALDIIHENTDTTATASTKQRFIKQMA